MEPNEDIFNYTIKSEEEFYNIVDSDEFNDKDAEMIYAYLNRKIKIIPFGDYLKRYIRKYAGFDEKSEEVNIEDYRDIIVDSFEENFTPATFTKKTAHITQLANNWLTQTSVKRNAVFLLGFGLRMSVEDVSEFLVHGLKERDFNFKNPFEVICWYCYKNGFKYPKFAQLIEEYNKLPYGDNSFASDATIGVRDMMMKAGTEEELLQNLSLIKTENDGHFYSVTASRYFEKLYNETREIIAEQYTEDSKSAAEDNARDYLEKMANSTAISLEEKNVRADAIRKSFKEYKAEDISEGDVEKFLCCGVPYNGKGNLFSFSKSTLAKHFLSKRMSRQHIYDIREGRTGVDRFDLITLNFFIHAMKYQETKKNTRYFNFVDETNKILEDCYFGKLYITNPYEAFVQMCILSESPMGAYSDVLEMSF